MPGAPSIARLCAMGGLHAAAGRSEAAGETTELPSSAPPIPPAVHPKPVKPPATPKTHKPPTNTGDKSFQNLAYLPPPTRYN
jgi:hypothetical protein